VATRRRLVNALENLKLIVDELRLMIASPCDHVAMETVITLATSLEGLNHLVRRYSVKGEICAKKQSVRFWRVLEKKKL